MKIIYKSLIIINTDINSIESRSIPEEFDQFIIKLITYINNNKNTRDYQSISSTTEVINCSLSLLERATKEISSDEKKFNIEKMENIAKRLLQKEIAADIKSKNLNSNIQKGSLIQSLLYDNKLDKYLYLLAKVEHINFFDEADFSVKTGFSEDDKKIWKTCLLDLTPIDNIISAKVYSNTGAKYWNNEFLELIEVTTDQVNTERAFKRIDQVLSRKIKKEAPHDYVVIRNKIIAYFRSTGFVDYHSLINDLSAYAPEIYPLDKFNETIALLKELPEKKSFDNQFNAVPSAIKAKIKTSYNVNRGIVLKVDGDIENLEDTIFSKREPDGEQYIVIKTNNEELFNTYKTT